MAVNSSAANKSAWQVAAAAAQAGAAQYGNGNRGEFQPYAQRAIHDHQLCAEHDARQRRRHPHQPKDHDRDAVDVEAAGDRCRFIAAHGAHMPPKRRVLEHNVKHKQGSQRNQQRDRHAQHPARVEQRVFVMAG